MNKNINLLQLLENCAEKMNQKDKEEREKDPVAYAKNGGNISKKNQF